MKHIVSAATIGLFGLLGTMAFAQDATPAAEIEASPEVSFEDSLSGLSTRDLNPLLKVNPSSLAVIEELRKRADAGDVDAMTRLGNAYRFGNGITRDVEAGLGYLNKAAQGNNHVGLLALGNALYQYAEDDDRQRNAALGMIESSFSQGNAGAAVSISQKKPAAWINLVQRELVARGYYLGTPDGVNGPLTQNALELFCTDREMSQDCTAGPFATPVVLAIARKFFAGE